MTDLIGSAFVAESGNIFVVVGNDNTDADRMVIFFPFVGTRGTCGTLPVGSITSQKQVVLEDGTTNFLDENGKVERMKLTNYL